MSEKAFDSRALKTHFSRAAMQYDDHAGLQQMVLRDAIGYAHEYWKPDMHIADIGCGTGMLAEEVAHRHFGWNITGCDISQAMCAQAQKRGEWVITADAHQLPFVAGSFDGVMSSLMLQWANDPKRVFSELRQVLKPNSYAVVSTFTQGTLHELEHSFAQIDSYGHVSRFHTRDEWRDFAVEAGFTPVERRDKTILQYYPDMMSLMRSIKVIGASHKGINRKRGMTTRHQIHRLEHIYRKAFATDKGLPVSWQLLYMIMKAA